MQTIQSSPAWQLAASITPIAQGHHLLISSYVPTARRPEHRVKLSATLTTDELHNLHRIIGAALGEPRNG